MKTQTNTSIILKKGNLYTLKSEKIPQQYKLVSFDEKKAVVSCQTLVRACRRYGASKAQDITFKVNVEDLVPVVK